jgi:predicted ATPase
MAQQRSKSRPRLRSNRQGITRIHVAGFKSISQERNIEIRPLTILAGANSSGKSSIMQPLLLLKQTLEASYDPGALLLNGPNLRFTSVSQLLSRMGRGKDSKKFYVGVELGPELMFTTYFKQNKNKRLEVEQTIYALGEEKHRFYMGMEQDEILSVLPLGIKKFSSDIEASLKEALESEKEESVRLNISFVIVRNRCFLTTALSIEDGPTIPILTYDAVIANHILQIIHLPGLRGNPERTYPVTAVGSNFPGTFEKYVASMIGQWQTVSDNDKLEKVNNDLVRLGLAGKVEAKAINDTQVELRINRLIQGNKLSSTKERVDDTVSIADVGLGVSQALPVVVAIHAADQGQLIYLEQPEIHLHPRAQTAMAEVLADAAMQGKRIVVETHSSLLLLGIQTLVAEGKLSPELVKLHWFTRQEDGSTKITSADLDESGAYGDWPEDFDTVTLDSENRYLNAAEARLRGN